MSKTGDRCIAVTGASGFIGQHVVDRLLARRMKVRALVRDFGSLPRHWTLDPGFEAVPLASPALRDCDALVHLAGLPAAPRHDAIAALQAVNVELTGTLVEAAKAAGVQLLVHLSSIRAVVGATNESPVDDQTLASPVDAYGRSKRMAEKLALAFADQTRTAVVLRPPLVIGGEAKGNWERLQAVANSRLWLPFGSVDNRRSYVSVQTLSEAICHLAARDWATAKSDAYLIADIDPVSLATAIRALRAGMDRPARLLHFPPQALNLATLVPGLAGSAESLFGNLVVDGSRFERVFAFRPPLPLLDAIRRSGMDYASAHA